MAATKSSYAVLVVDDEPDLRTLYELTLLREGYQVEAASDLRQARELLQAGRYHAVITDMRLPDGQGLELLRELSARQRPEKTIVITAYGSPENAVEALKCGAFDYLTKPVDLKQFRNVVASAVSSHGGADQGPASIAAASVGPAFNGSLARIVGESACMVQVKQRIERVARSMAPVLLQGESGTGKELVARAVHDCSHRASGPFIAVNCGAIPENLIEAEFFGVRKGAYTGATQDRDGYFQAARGGTLFLDEIGDLPLSMQAKLLRVIQERHVRALGAVQEEPVDVRLVSATHKDLATEVRAGRFRQDLFYRIHVIEIRMPALRERREDLPALTRTLLERLSADGGHPPPRLSERALQWLQTHPLPGNVRELENLLHRALALGSGEILEPEDLCDPLREDASAYPTAPVDSPPLSEAVSGPEPVLPTDLQAYLDQQEREVLLRVLKETHYNRTLAASRLGLNLRQIRYRIQRLNIPTPSSGSDHEE